ncbi:MAG: T9SS type A sorting domain-containing protein [Saprospiraceae bacterium]
MTVHNLRTLSYSYLIYNFIGQIVQEGIVNEFQNKIEIRNLSSGLYFLEIKGKDYTLKEKFFKE